MGQKRGFGANSELVLSIDNAKVQNLMKEFSELKLMLPELKKLNIKNPQYNIDLVMNFLKDCCPLSLQIFVYNQVGNGTWIDAGKYIDSLCGIGNCTSKEYLDKTKLFYTNTLY